MNLEELKNTIKDKSAEELREMLLERAKESGTTENNTTEMINKLSESIDKRFNALSETISTSVNSQNQETATTGNEPEFYSVDECAKVIKEYTDEYIKN